MEARSLKISWKIMMVPPIYVLLLGLYLIVLPGPSIAKNYQLFMGHPWADFVASNARLVIFLSMLNQLIGVQVIGYAIVTIAIILKAYRRREKWAWYVLLAGNTLGFSSVIAWEAATNLIPALVINAIMLVVTYIGLAISAKAIFTNNPG